jgi:hypothetical protein
MRTPRSSASEGLIGAQFRAQSEVDLESKPDGEVAVRRPARVRRGPGSWRARGVAAHAGPAFDGQHLFQLAEDRIQKIDPKTGRGLATISIERSVFPLAGSKAFSLSPAANQTC